MRPGLALKVDTLICQLLKEFCACQWTLVRKYSADDVNTSRTNVFIQTQFFTSPSITRHKHGTEERQKPANVI
jgi:hypothetical protein